MERASAIIQWCLFTKAAGQAAPVGDGVAAGNRSAPPGRQLSGGPGQALQPSFSGFFLWLLMPGFLASLPFILFQKKLLSPILARSVARAYFWPTLPLTLFRSWWGGQGLWCTIDETLVLGVVPVALLGHLRQLKGLGVRGVVNMQDEYLGPEAEYEKLQILQLRLPTIDHTEPTLQDLQKACKFIDAYRARGERAYVHCKAGHGRAAAVALAWLAYSRGLEGSVPDGLQQLNAELVAKRQVRKRLHEQPNLRAFAAWLQEEGRN